MSNKLMYIQGGKTLNSKNSSSPVYQAQMKTIKGFYCWEQFKHSVKRGDVRPSWSRVRNEQ